jgi:hypothetical protein
LYKNQEEDLKKSLPRFFNNSSAEHVDELANERKKQRIYKTSFMNNLEKLPSSSKTRETQGEQDQLVCNSSVQRIENLIEAERILGTLKHQLKLEAYPTFSNKIENKLKVMLGCGKKSAKTSSCCRPGRLVSQIQSFIRNVTRISVFLIIEHSSKLMGHEDEIIVEI